ncbi:MAG: hypothetical protein IKA17_04105 [Clostridia bacterium]|nr:hypothetical protein [Clostridia bacterium]
MKRFILLLLAFVLVLGLAGCKEKPALGGETNKPEVQTESKELTELKDRIKADGKLIGVAYLGWIEGDAETAKAELSKLDYVEDISFIKDIEKYAENEGYRMYAIVPADNQVTITVCKCEFGEEYLPYDGEELIEANEPILVRGNISDTIPNLYVIAKKGSEKIEYTPVQSGMDGRLENNENKVYDFTPYDFMAEFSAYDRVPDVVFCGSWIAFENDGNGEERALGLELNPDGTVSYVYGIGNSEVLEQFEGTWTLDENDILKLELVGGPPESVENPVVAEPYDCNPSFEWEMTAEGLSLTHIDGDEILYGTKGNTFEFYINEY